MNLSTAIFLINKDVRSVRVSYDPDHPKANLGDKLFKTLDPAVKKGDYVIVATNTRHGFTCGKVEETDFAINFDTHDQYAWIVGRVDKTAYDQIVEQEATAMQRVAKAEENRKRQELADSLKLAEVDFSGLGVAQPGPALIQAPVTPRGAPPEETPPPAPDHGPASDF